MRIAFFNSFIRRYLLVITLLAATFAVLISIIRYTSQQVWHINIYGNLQHTVTSKVEEKAKSFLVKDLYSLDIDSLKKELLLLPWIESVHISKKWPRTLAISLTEKRAVAVWNDNWLFEKGGQTFFPEDVPDLDLPRVVGPVGHHRLVFEQYARARDILDKHNLSIKQFISLPHGAIEILLNNNVKLSLGSKEPFVRLQRFVKLEQDLKLMQQKGAETIDLRYPSGLALGKRN